MRIPPIDAELALAEVQIRREQVVGTNVIPFYFWPSLGTLMLIFVVAALGLTLEAVGAQWPATISIVPVALGLAVGGPLLMACLRRVMLSRPLGGER
jgi:hypothetical protein